MNPLPEKIFAEAFNAAQVAAKVENAKYGPEYYRGLDCGFAWVTVRPARGTFVKWLKTKGIGSLAYKGGWEIWYSSFSLPMTQSVSVHEAAAKAFAGVLGAYGLAAYVGSRLD